MGITLKNIKREELIRNSRPKPKEKPISDSQMIRKIKSGLLTQTRNLNFIYDKEMQMSTIERFTLDYLLFKKRHNRNPDNSEVQGLINKTLAQTYIMLQKKKKAQKNGF